MLRTYNFSYSWPSILTYKTLFQRSNQQSNQSFVYNTHSLSVLNALYAAGHHIFFFITKSWKQFRCPMIDDKLCCPCKYNVAITNDIFEDICVVLMFYVVRKSWCKTVYLCSKLYIDRKNENSQDINNKYLHVTGLWVLYLFSKFSTVKLLKLLWPEKNSRVFSAFQKYVTQIALYFRLLMPPLPSLSAFTLGQCSRLDIWSPVSGE